MFMPDIGTGMLSSLCYHGDSANSTLSYFPPPLFPRLSSPSSLFLLLLPLISLFLPPILPSSPFPNTARCDFPLGSAEQLWDSLQKLLSLPPETRVLVCHDYPGGRNRGFRYLTSIKEELESNVHVKQGTKKDEYITARETRDSTLAPPKLIVPSLAVSLFYYHTLFIIFKHNCIILYSLYLNIANKICRCINLSHTSWYLYHCYIGYLQVSITFLLSAIIFISTSIHCFYCLSPCLFYFIFIFLSSLVELGRWSYYC